MPRNALSLELSLAPGVLSTAALGLLRVGVEVPDRSVEASRDEVAEAAMLVVVDAMYNAACASTSA